MSQECEDSYRLERMLYGLNDPKFPKWMEKSQKKMVLFPPDEALPGLLERHHRLLVVVLSDLGPLSRV